MNLIMMTFTKSTTAATQELRHEVVHWHYVSTTQPLTTFAISSLVVWLSDSQCQKIAGQNSKTCLFWR